MRVYILFAIFAVTKADVGGYTYGIRPNGGYITGGSFGAESKRNEVSTGINKGSTTGGSFDGSLAGPALGSAGSSLAAPSSDSFRVIPLGSARDSLQTSLVAPASDSLLGNVAAPSTDSLRTTFNGPNAGNSETGFGAASNYAPLTDYGFNKEYFTFSAPESEFAASEPIEDISQSLKKNLRVVFIRAPEHQGITNAALNLAKQAVNEKTAIYVLTKQPDVSELANRLQQINGNINNKPEVHFVKYRTPEDAARAQHAIQEQYDNLGGSSRSHDGGIAPVLNFVSNRPVNSGHNGRVNNNIGQDVGGLGAATSNSYIPPAILGGSSSSPSSTYLPASKF